MLPHQPATLSAIAGGTDEPTVPSLLLTGDEAAGDVVLHTLPDKVAISAAAPTRYTKLCLADLAADLFPSHS